jgi:hypothetical protein
MDWQELVGYSALPFRFFDPHSPIRVQEYQKIAAQAESLDLRTLKLAATENCITRSQAPARERMF